MQFDFEVLHDEYLVFKIGLRVFYIALKNDPKRASPRVLESMKLQPRKGHILSLHSTSQPHLLQTCFVNDLSDQKMLIMTWNLKDNCEYSISKVNCDSGTVRMNSIYKSPFEDLNYFISPGDDFICNLEFEFPLNTLSGSKTRRSKTSEDVPENCQEMKVASD